MQPGLRLKTVAPALAAAAGIGSFSLWYRLVRMPLPQEKGRIKLRGLEGDVDLLRDHYGVPHIKAGSIHDLLFAQGFCQAQDRLWHMEFLRRVAYGRLSEFAGAETLKVDILTRTLGFGRLAREESGMLDPELRADLEHYVAGINAAVGQAKTPPAEFQILRIKPGPWEIEHLLAVSKVLSLALATNWEMELMRAELVQHFGPETAAKLESHYPYNNPVVLKQGEGYKGKGVDIAAQIMALRETLGLTRFATGSNNWVVSGERSVTGKPLLANDPHMGASMPPLCHRSHLICGDIDAHGVSLPCMPGIGIGQNRNAAWGFTNSLADVQDLYLERLRTTAGTVEYEFKGEWLPAEVTFEEIEVKGRDPEKVEVIVTHHGPIVNSVLEAHEHEPLALAWTALRFPNVYKAHTRGFTASTAHEVVEIFDDYASPTLNMVYADSGGDIGYRMVGRVPLRQGDMPDLPKPGWTGEYEWDGYIPYDEMPQALNPESGYIVTANNRVVDDDYPYHITSEWLAGYRAKRIEQLLLETEKHTLESFEEIQADLYSIPAMETTARLARLEFEDELNKPLEYLWKWDGRMDSEAVGGTVVQVFLIEFSKLFVERVFEGKTELGNKYLAESSNDFMPIMTSLWHAQSRLLELWDEGDSDWLSGGSWDDLAKEAVTNAIAHLRENYGKDPLKWQWGKIHPISFVHPLGEANQVFEKIFSRKIKGFGSQETVCQVGYVPTNPFDGAWIPSYRMVSDLSDISKSRWQLPGGQSGHLGSKHYDDLLDGWIECRGNKTYATFEEVRQAGGSRHLELLAED